MKRVQRKPSKSSELTWAIVRLDCMTSGHPTQIVEWCATEAEAIQWVRELATGPEDDDIYFVFHLTFKSTVQL